MVRAVGGGIDARALLPASMAGLPAKSAMVCGRAAVIRQPRGKPRHGDADLVAVVAVGQAAGLVDADQVVALAEDTPAPPMSSAPSSAVLAATIVLYKVVLAPAIHVHPAADAGAANR